MYREEYYNEIKQCRFKADYGRKLPDKKPSLGQIPLTNWFENFKE